ncbi:MAG: hypothetical protein ACM3KM_04155 [Acidobacteriaceae bacterium]
MNLSNKEDYAKLVCLFLAEGLLTREIRLERAADIAEKVVTNINLLDSEFDFLKLIKDISKDFEEVTRLESKVKRIVRCQVHTETEAKVKEFAVFTLRTNPKLALTIMQETVRNNPDLNQLAEKFQEFKQYLLNQKNEPVRNN